MKIKDVFVGQSVGFVTNGDRHKGIVTSLENIPKDGKGDNGDNFSKDRWIAKVETKDVVFEINIKYLLGVVK